MILFCAKAKRLRSKTGPFSFHLFKALIIWAGVLATCSCFPPAAPGDAKKPLGSGLLLPRDDAWLGADGAISVPLAENLRLWLFGDTWLRHQDGTLKLVSNSVGIQEGECSDAFEPHWGQAATAAFGSTEPKGSWLWPAGGVLLQEGIFLVFHHMERRGPGPWDFAVLGSQLVSIADARAPPCSWHVRSKRLPWTAEDFLPACSPVIQGGHVLLFGTRSLGAQRGLFLARLKKRFFAGLELETGWEFWGGEKGWSVFLKEAQPLLEGVGTEVTVASDPRGQGWICVYSPGGISSQIVLHRAPAPQGPWGKPQNLFTCPEAASQSLYCYGAKFHPGCSSLGLWVTYSVNSKDGLFPGPDTARPRWLLLPHP